MKYLILGAGPAGLSFANTLLEKNITDFLVLEKEEEPGGLCRSADVDGAALDIGGGHFLDVRRPKVNEFLFRFMPESEWAIFDRDSRISVGEQMINHPFEANIWQMDETSQKKYLDSIARAGCNSGAEMPESFVEWIRWKLGDAIAEDYMLPYNGKMFGEDLDALGTYWLEKLPNVSYEETLLSCQNRRPYGTQPGHAKFYYPKKYGYGELWKRMGEALGGHIEYNKTVCALDFSAHTVKTADGDSYRAEHIITTIPWTCFEELAGMPEEIKTSVSRLKHSGVQIAYYPEKLDTKAQWIYCPDPALSYHRILVRHNFCAGSRGYWTETNRDRLKMEVRPPMYSHLNEYAYPLNTKDKPEIMKKLLAFAEENRVFGLGRWGEHQHYNSDLTVELGMKLAEEKA